MKTTLLKNVLLDRRTCNILVEGNLIKATDVPANTPAEAVVDASGQAILPAFYNMHTHAAMNLLKGYADDMPLMKWLTEYIWPFEDKLTAQDIRKGSRMAVDEMLSTGSVLFNDMYFDIEETIDIVREAGIRAAIGITVMENHSKAVEERKWEFVRRWQDPTGGRIRLVIAPHAIYSVGAEKLKKSAAFARERGLKLHIHVSETENEVRECLKQHGMTPVRYLDRLGFLGPDVIAAHCVHVDKEEWDILAERGVTVVHNPCSNMKLGSGRFPYELAIASGVRITLGTDGTSSNNNLDMREECKFAALLAKVNGDPTLLTASEVFKWATQNGAETFGISGGVIAPGKVADFILVHLNAPKMQPCHNLVSNWIYAADSSIISSVWCDGVEVFRKQLPLQQRNIEQ